jgi:uncharacterized protein with PIN domain
MTDPYARLRNPGPTPPDEICACADSPPLVLQGRLEPNPLACLRCNGEVAPESVPIPPDLVDEIAAWRDLHDALFQLWLDCGEYQDWAAGELRDARKPAPKRGLALIAKLHAARPAYYWWFTDRPAEERPPPTACPQCRGELTAVERGMACSLCRIVVA